MSNEVIQQGLTLEEGYEMWAMQTDSCQYIEILGHNRFGQPMAKQLPIGPNRKGFQFQITPHDRVENQRLCVNPGEDPFRNGTFLRVDADQQADPNTKSQAALSVEDLLGICDLEQDVFEVRVAEMPEVPLRRLADVAVSMDIGHRKVSFLQENIRERFAAGSPQKSLAGNGERLS